VSARGRLSSQHGLLSDPPLLRRGIGQLLLDNAPAQGSNYVHVIPGQYWERIVAMSFNYLAGAAAGYRGLSFQIQDGDGVPFVYMPIAGPLLANQSVTCYGIVGTPTPQEYETSQSIEGEQITPAAGATIATLASLPAGDYQVEWTVGLSGTLAAGTDNDNFLLSAPGISSIHSINEAVAGNYPQETVDVTLASPGTIKVLTGVLATTGAVYDAQITVIPLQPFAAPFQLPDITLQAGWTVSVVASNIQSNDQFSGFRLYLERYASDYASGDDEMQTEQILRRVIREELSSQWQ
jgi:hypothetical protein